MRFEVEERNHCTPVQNWPTSPGQIRGRTWSLVSHMLSVRLSAPKNKNVQQSYVAPKTKIAL